MAFSVSDEAAEADSLRMTFDAAPEAAAPADFDDSNDVSFDDWAVADEAELDDRMVAESAPSIVLDTDDAVEVNVIQRNFDDDPVALPIITPDDPSGRRVIYTVNMDLQSDDFVNAINLLVTTVGEMDGFPMDNHIRGRDMRHPERERSATYILRLPTENLAEFIVTIMENYNILELHLMSDDITLMYERDSWQIDDLDELEQRLTDELDNEDLDGSERLDIEAIIAQIQFDLRDLEQWRSALDYDIFYSTINVRLYEAIMPIEETDEDDENYVDQDLTFGEMLSQTAANSFGAVIGLFEGLLIVIVRILPTLLILAVITIVIIVAVRKYKKRKKADEKEAANDTSHQNVNNNAYRNDNNQNNVYVDQNAPNTAQNPNNVENQNDSQ